MISNTNKLQNDSHCILYLPFKDSVTSEQSRGKSEVHTITNNGSVAITTVVGKPCASFNGSDQYLSIPDSDDFNFGSHQFTISFWIYFNDLSGTMALIGKFNYGVSKEWLIQYRHDTLQLDFWYTQDRSTDVNYLVSWSPSLNTWYLITLIRKNITDTQFYIDGQKLGLAYTSNYTVYNGLESLLIGSTKAFNSQTSFLNGYISGLSIHKGIARFTRNFTPHDKLI